ncbi:TonB-dependent receptor plug domain-containing protein [Maribellus mangrovi]|uniref:TonB-dependent receptor plug domain-containing protein n=1 Tax=Maribellus mangrovi TaxID=3133146 RepID=UPI0030ED6D19
MNSNKFKQDAQSVLTFRKWGNKNYSLFLALKRTVVIGVLSVVYFLATPVVSLAIEQDTSEVKMEFDLDEIEVSAQRSPVMYSQVARILSVIERKEIEAVAAQSVQDLLEYVAGVDVRQRGAEGVQADVSIRGGTFDQTLILLNGINITDPQTGHHNLNLPLSLSQIQRIEILEGPAARVYGPNAFSGAINIVTRQDPKNTLSLLASGGSFGYFDGNAAGTMKTGKMSHLLAFSGKRSDGYINNTDFKEFNGFYSNQLDAKRGTFKFQLGASKKGFGANSFYTPKYPNQYEATKTLFSSIKWEGKGPLHITPVFYYRRHQDRFELFRSDPASWYSGHNYHLTNVYGTNINSWFKWNWGRTAFGIEHRSENILSNVLGEPLDNPKDVPGEDARFTKSDQRNIFSGFIEHAAYFNDWTITTGLMVNYISDSDIGLHIFPGIDVSYHVNEPVKLFASYNTSLRMPTFTDLHYEGPTNIGNPNLKPEKSATLEGGVKLNGKLLKGQLVVFHRNGTDIIDWVKTDVDDEVWQPKNLTEINSIGFEAQTQFLFRKYYGISYPNLQLNYLFNNVEKGESDFISNYVLDNLRHKLVISANQQFLGNFYFDVKLVFQDREGSYTRFEDTNPIGEVPYDPFWLMDAKLSYKNKGMTIFASVNNIFDQEYNDIGNVIQPGRWLKAGVAWEIDFSK